MRQRCSSFFCIWISVIPATALVPPAPLVETTPLVSAAPLRFASLQLKGSPCLGSVTQHLLPHIFRPLFRFFPPCPQILHIHSVPKQVHPSLSLRLCACMCAGTHPCFLRLSHTSQMPELNAGAFPLLPPPSGFTHALRLLTPVVSPCKDRLPACLTCLHFCRSSPFHSKPCCSLSCSVRLPRIPPPAPGHWCGPSDR